MNLKIYKPITPSLRNTSLLSFSKILSKGRPSKKLTYSIERAYGHNCSGHITSRHKGGGHKRLYREIDFKRNKIDEKAQVKSIEYDPNRNCWISLLSYASGLKQYIISPENLLVGATVISSNTASIDIGNSLQLKYIPVGTIIHNIELYPGKGGQICRSAGSFAKILAKEKNYILVRLQSKEIRIFKEDCRATIGRVSNSAFFHQKRGKAGRNRWLGKRPHVRGSAMNPIDHPHGGGEGKSPIGRKAPLTPWGKKTLGIKTRKHFKYSTKFIIKKRSD